MSEELTQASPAEAAPLIVHVEFDDGTAPLDVNVDAITFDDYALLEQLESQETAKGLTMTTIRDSFNRFIVGGVGHLSPRRDMRRIGLAIGRAIRDASDPNS